MALTTEASGTQTCVIATEHTLATDTDARSFVAMFNFTNAQAGDAFRLKVTTKVLTGDTAAVVFDRVVAWPGLAAEPIVYSPPIPSAFSITVTLTQTDGTGRAVPWSLLSL
jgi:hypothetical protein